MNVETRFTKIMLGVGINYSLVFALVLIFGNSDRAVAANDDETAIAAIREIGGIVRQVSNENEQDLEVEFHLRGRDLSDDQLTRVGSVKSIVSLNLRDTQITGKGLVHLKGLTSLRKLHLERTRVDDEGIAHLANLKNLEYLNLYATNITDKSLEHLEKLKQLKTLYVWQTKVTDGGVRRLQQKCPNLKIERGVDLSKLPTYAEVAANKPKPKVDLKWIAVSRAGEAPKSENGVNTTVIFENKSDRIVKIYWVSYGNELKLYGTLEPKATREQNTYANNSWLITDEKETPLGYFIVKDELSRAVIPAQ